MPFDAARLAAVLAAVCAAGAILWWPRLAEAPRRALALLASLAGLGFLIAALHMEGHRAAQTTGRFLLGDPYVLERAAATASLPYYLLTAVALLLGTLGLAAGERAAARLAGHPLASAIGLSFAVTLLRFALEKVAAPPTLTNAVGIVWLGPLVGAFLAAHAARGPSPRRTFARALVLYAFAARAGVAFLNVVASSLKLGSHYDVTPFVSLWWGGRLRELQPGSLSQVLLVGLAPQLLFWPFFTLAWGAVGGLAHAGLQRVIGRAQPAARSYRLVAPDHEAV